MNKVKIITDSCCSLSTAELDRLGADYVQMSIMIDDQIFDAYDCPIKNPEEYYAKIKTAGKVSTGCVNVQTFTDIFEKYTQLGYDVVYMGLSSGLSSTNDNAVHAAEHVNKTCGKHVWVADTLTGSFSVAVMVEKACQMVAENKSAQEIFDYVNKNKMKTICYFMPYDLQFLKRCGRLNKVVATFGTMLKIAPILSNDPEGKLKTVANCMGRKKAIKTLQNLLLTKMDTTTEEKIYIGHTGQLAEAEEMAKFIKDNTQNKQIEIGYLDYTMGASCGPETLAVFVTLK